MEFNISETNSALSGAEAEEAAALKPISQDLNQALEKLEMAPATVQAGMEQRPLAREVSLFSWLQPRSSFLIVRIWSGPVPQQPPMILMPASAKRWNPSAMYSGDSG